MTRQAVIQVRVSKAEKASMTARAEKAGLKLSEWVRLRALDEAPGNTERSQAEPLAEPKAVRVSPVPPRAPQRLGKGSFTPRPKT